MNGHTKFNGGCNPPYGAGELLGADKMSAVTQVSGTAVVTWLPQK